MKVEGCGTGAGCSTCGWDELVVDAVSACDGCPETGAADAMPIPLFVRKSSRMLVTGSVVPERGGPIHWNPFALSIG